MYLGIRLNEALNIVFHRRGGEALVNLGQEVCEF